MKKLILLIFLINHLFLYSQNTRNANGLVKTRKGLPFFLKKLTVNSGLICYTNSYFLINNSLKNESLKILKTNKQGRNIIAFELFNYYNKSNTINHDALKLYIPVSNFMAVFNESTMNYNFYPSGFKINFDMNSTRTADKYFNRANMIDSFNPYGVYKPQAVIAFGLLNLILKRIQE